MPKTFILGRDASSADLAIADPSISRRHAEIVLLDDTRVFVRDLGSANGSTLVRRGARTPLAREVIARDDVVQFGDVSLTFEALRDMLFEQLGRAPAAQPEDGAPSPDRRDDANRGPDRLMNDAPPPARRQEGGVLDPDRSRRPGLGEFLPIGGLQLLGSRGMLLPAILFSLLLMRLMWLLRQPGDEAVASFVVEFCAAIATLGFVAVYRLCGKHKPLKVILAVIAVEAAIMSLHGTLNKPFCETTGARTIMVRAMIAEGTLKIPIEPQVPGGSEKPQYVTTEHPGFLKVWYAQFCCAGLIEELEKMLPVFALIWLTAASRRTDTKLWGVFEPLDAIVYAAAAALAFILIETLFGNTYVGGALQEARKTGMLYEEALSSFPLAILRTVKGMAGHIAYSGYFAYFVGLGLLRPRHRERYWLGGWIGASIVHGLFNASPRSVSSLVSVAAFFLLLAVILKARQLSPTRDENFATRAVPRAKAI
jgi:RsiW-degrading membrane proteinase PrsW (M82 family)